MNDSPSPTGANGEGNGGRGPDGRFGRGNGCGRGNPHAKRVAQLRGALLDAVSPADLKAVAAALLAQAKAGDVAAARELFQRLLGPPVDLETLDRIAALERQVAVALGLQCDGSTAGGSQ
jgi:hypothetical protein